MRTIDQFPAPISPDGYRRADESRSLNNQQIQDALDFCHDHGITEFVLAVPFDVPLADICTLRKDSRVVGLIVAKPSQEVRSTYNNWMGCYLPDSYTWTLPPQYANTIVFVGTRSRITFRMLKSSARHGIRRIVCCTPMAWVNLSIVYLIICRICSYAAAKTERFSKPVTPLFNTFFNTFFTTFKVLNTSRVLLPKRLYTRFLSKAQEFAASRVEAIPGRVVLINSALAAGGAERQVVSTLQGLREKRLEATLLCEDLYSRSGHDFFLGKVQKLDIPVREVRRGVKPMQYVERLSRFPDLLHLLNKMPCALRDDVIDLYMEFRILKPEVVHAWQDSTSIKVGMAATLAGVPHIVLSSRNVSPPHFAYHQDYMKPAYQALSEFDQIVFINNSRAGAEDYARWLGIPSSRFTLVRNGLDLTALHRAKPEEIARFRAHLKIPPGVHLVGSVFRYWPEKRPLLWIEMAAKIASQAPDVHFLIVGWGPLRSEMERMIDKLGLGTQFHLVEERSDIATPVSSMDVFVLTSEYEGTPNVVIESQQLGVPVVATKAGGTGEAMAPGITGWIVDPPTPAALAAQVLSVLNNGQALAIARATGPEFVRSTFGIERMVRETLAAYRVPAFTQDLVEPNLVHNARASEERRDRATRFDRPAFTENHIARVE
ncbi:hypothetical protein W02_13540 [Nitrospira sp. KM1]|uniref:glycosyltransferase n=1 Tax=Nitrospira sp. KM1 TaxID=1936990 RepID=UPI0013A77291|nr:glycosyltransferase [Nitrospira sp. KM1]BCA54214.1 hypothetical protein W02_13540 [Nitrospira sp. KM1]